MPRESQPSVNDLLRSAQDQLRRTFRMAESGRPCPEILQQVAALQAALRVLRRQLIRLEAQICLDLLQKDTCQEQQGEIVDLLLAMCQL